MSRPRVSFFSSSALASSASVAEVVGSPPPRPRSAAGRLRSLRFDPGSPGCDPGRGNRGWGLRGWCRRLSGCVRGTGLNLPDTARS